MLLRIIPLALLVAALPVLAQAAEPPVVLVKIASFDDLMTKATYLAGLVKQSDKAREADAFLRAALGDEAFEAIDPQRPMIGFLAAQEGNFRAPVLALPVNDPDKLLNLLKRFGLDAEKGAKGIYALDLPGLPGQIYLRMAEKYAFVTFADAAALGDAKLAIPAEALQGDPGLATITVRLDRIPDLPFKQIVLSQLELRLADGKEPKPGETPVATAVKVAVIDGMANLVKQLLTQGQELTIRLDIDAKSEELTAKVLFSGHSGTQLAKNIAALGRGANFAAGLLKPEASLNVGIHLALPEDVRKVVNPLIDDIVKEAIAHADENQRALAEDLLNSLLPTVKAGVLDLGITARPGPDGDMTLLIGLGLVEGQKIEQSLRKVAEVIPERDRTKLKLDVAKAGTMTIHEIQTPTNEQQRRLFGDGPAYLALRPDGMLLAFGPGALPQLKSLDPAPKRHGRLMDWEFNLAQLATRFARTDAEAKSAERITRLLFKGDPKGRDQVRFRVTGGEALTAELSVQGGVISLGYLLNDPSAKPSKAPRPK